MNASGVSVNLGPFDLSVPALPAIVNPVLHATLVNCTPPAGRSGPLADVLQSMPGLAHKLARLLPAKLSAVPEFSLEFPSVALVSGLVIAQSAPHPTIVDLKSRLQGDPRAIPPDQAQEVLSSPNSAGIDKYSQSLDRAELVHPTRCDHNRTTRSKQRGSDAFSRTLGTADQDWRRPACLLSRQGVPLT